MTSGPAFATFTPSVINTGAKLYISVPIGNTGAAVAPSVWLTAGTLGAAPRLSPAVFRIFMGDLASGNNANVNMIFSAAGFAVGSRLLLTLRGTYSGASGTLGFSLNRFVVIPGVSSLPIVQLNAAASVSVSPDTWSYSISNNEPSGSNLYVASFSLDVSAPVNITGSPPGWVGQTDNATYAAWYADDQAQPYPHQVAPGASLGGFQVESATDLSQSTAYVLTSWDHGLDAAGRLFSDYISAPSQM